MPLEKIKSYVEHRTQGLLLALFQQERKNIREKIKYLQKAEKWIQSKSKSIEEAMSEDFDSISVQYQSESYLIQSEVETSENITWARKIGELFDYCSKNQMKSPYSIGYRQNMEDIKKGIFDDYHVFYEKFDEKPAKLEYTVKAQGDYLVAYHRGDWRKIGDTYKKILEFAREEHILLEEYFYEDYLQDSFSMKKEEDYITKITCRVIGA